MKWLILMLGVLCNASASVLVKMAMTPPRPIPTLQEPLLVLHNWPLLAGVGLYGGAFVLYAVALTQLPLNVAHPVLTAGAIATVALCSLLLFREPFAWTTWLGIGFVLVGVILITARSH
jgi:multidrug transporter EmrE-like cation transporter